jgi:hypothetical protein
MPDPSHGASGSSGEGGGVRPAWAFVLREADRQGNLEVGRCEALGVRAGELSVRKERAQGCGEFARV